MFERTSAPAPRCWSLLLLAAALACSPGTSNGDGKKGSGDAPISAELIEKVCSANYVDGSSKIFVARDASGEVKRLIVTPTNKIADMGNLIFDMEGKHLGNQTGGEFPWEDEALMAKERQRVAALMDGAEESERDDPIQCKK
jgi:hypothetical protein